MRLLAAKRHAHAQPLEHADVQAADSPPVGKQANIHRVVPLVDQPGRRAIYQARQLDPVGRCRSSGNTEAQYQPLQNPLPLANSQNSISSTPSPCKVIRRSQASPCSSHTWQHLSGNEPSARSAHSTKQTPWP